MVQSFVFFVFISENEQEYPQFYQMEGAKPLQPTAKKKKKKEESHLKLFFRTQLSS